MWMLLKFIVVWQEKGAFMRYLILFFSTLLLCLGLVTKADASYANLPVCDPLLPVATETETIHKPITAKIQAIATDPSTTKPSGIQIQCNQNKGNQLSTRSILVNDPALQAVLQNLKEGDQVTLSYDEANKNVLKNLSVSTYKLDWLTPLATLVSAMILMGVLLWVLLRLSGHDLWCLILGKDKRYSNSKTQVFLWFFVLIGTYIAALVLRWIYGGIDFFGGVAIPQNLLTLSGLSGLTFVTAKAITQSKAESKTPADKPKFPNDLFQDDEGEVDLGDFQMIVVTLLTVGVYLVQAYSFLSVIELHKGVILPDIDTTLLATFGLGQGAYLVKKQIETVAARTEKPKIQTHKPETSS
ncbi:MAG: hypothetical protein ACM37W_25445 [Actinomycetota bacterium]